MAPESESDGIYKAVLEAAVDAIIISDESGQIVNVNSATLSLFGYVQADLIGQNVKILMPEGQADRHDGYMHHHHTTGEQKIIGIGRDLEAKHRDGSIFPIHLSIGRTVLDGSPAFVGIIHDLRKRRKAEEIAARAHRMEAIGQLTGGITHDFNNLLTVVIGNLELLEPRLTQKDNKELLSDALEAAELGADLTSRLLGLAKDVTPEVQELDMKEVTSKLQTLLDRTLGPQIDFQTVLEPDVWKVLADPSALQTALLNLALNAKDAMPEGGRLILETTNADLDDPYIAAETGIHTGQYVKISMSDTGHGMDADTKQRAFEPLFTTKANGKGTGFGLSMVYNFMQQSSGHVTLYSEIGKGSTFSLYFPRSTPQKSKPGSKEAPPTASGQGEKILVVEDDEKVRKLSVMRLKELGYQVIQAENADRALEIIAKEPKIALVFTDVVMPGNLSGYDLAERLRESHPGLKTLLTSGYSGAQIPENDPETHAYPMLRKPFRQVELARMLQTLLSEPPTKS